MADTTGILRQTPLHALHLALGAKMVPFSGYEMPVQYPAGVLKEHLHTREKAGLFDVSHMGQAFLSGADPAKALERLTPADVIGLKEGMQRYGLLLTEPGTIKDDFMFSRLAGEDALYLVVNARAPRTTTSPISPTNWKASPRWSRGPIVRCSRCRGRLPARRWSVTRRASTSSSS